MDELRQLYAQAASFRARRAALAKELVRVDERFNKQKQQEESAFAAHVQTLEQKRRSETQLIGDRAEQSVRAYIAKRDSLSGYSGAVEQWCPKYLTASYVPQPERVDERELNSLLQKLEEGGIIAWIKRTFRLDGYASRAEMARELYEKIEDAKAYCQDRIDQIVSSSERDKQRQTTLCRRGKEAEEEALTKKLRELETRRDREREQAREEIRRFDSSAELAGMHGQLRQLYEAGAESCGTWGVYTAPRQMPEQVLLCNATVTLPDQNGIDTDMGVPVWLKLFESNIVVVTGPNGPNGGADCVEKTLARKLLARLLKTAPTDDVSYTVFDPLYKGASLERLIDVTNIGTTDLSFDLFTSDESGSGSVTCAERRKYLRSLPAEINKYMAGRHTSLFAFNREDPDSEFPFTWIVDFHFPDEIDDRLANDMRELLVNADAAGYSFVFVTGEKGLRFLQGVVRQYTEKPIVHLDCSKWLCTMGDLQIPFTAEGAPEADQIYNFMTALKDYYVRGAAVDNRIDTVFAQKGIQLLDATKKLSIPMALDSKGRLADLVLGGEGSVHGFISGSTNSGKSTLLHTVILSACLHYSPEDLEIWLVDYKQTELILYRRERPPHVKLIGLSKTADFTFSLLDKIEAEAARRTELINRFDERDWTGYLRHRGEPGYEHFPRLLLIVDEFHEMSQFVSAESSYKDKLENTLREYRAQGITCLLADQTFSSGLSGLTPAAKNQIGLRIAMRNETSPQEIRDTLEVDRAFYSDSMQQAISLMSQGDFIMKVYIRDSNGKITGIKLEKFKALWSKETDIRPVARVLRDIWSDYVDDQDLIYVNTNEQVPWSQNEAEALDRMEPIHYPDLRLYLGRSATLQPCFGLDIGRQPNQNLSIVGGTAHQRWELIAAIMRSCAFKGYKLLVFMAEYSDLYSEHRDEIRALCRQVPGAELIEETVDWCRRLPELEAIVDQRKKSDDTVCIFIGLDVTDMEMSRLPDRTGSGGNTGSFRSAFRAVPTSPAPLKPQPPAPRPKSPILSEAGLMAAIGATPADEEAREMLAGVRTPAAPSSFAAPAPAAPEEPPVEEFNVMPILDKLFSRGSGYGIRCVAEVSVYRQFAKILKIREMCKHRVAFSMSADDCLMYLGNSNFQKSIGKFAVYSDGGKDIKKLLPYQLEQ